MEKIKYGLFHKGKNQLLGFTVQSNADGDCCCDMAYSLDTDTDNEWLVDDALTAAYVRQYSTEWYNAGYDTPINRFEPEELEVVKVTITTEVVDVTVPTFEEYLREKYLDKESKYYNPGHVEFIMGELKKGGQFAPYSVYDLRILRGEKEMREVK